MRFLPLMLLGLVVAGCGGSSATNDPGTTGPQFVRLADPGSWSEALDVSADGSVTVGTSETTDLVAVLWRGSQATPLGTLGGAFSEGGAISADGRVVVGGAKDADDRQRAFRWTEQGGMTSLIEQDTASFALGVSEDGSTVVGWMLDQQGQERAMRWTEATGAVDLGTLGGSRSMATDVSNDGNVVVGGARETTGDSPFVWTQAGGMESLGSLGGGSGTAEAVNAGGDVVVGSSVTAGSDTHAFRWSRATGMVDLGTLSGETSSTALDVSANGGVIVGTSGERAVMWIDGSIQDLNVTFASIIPSGWRLTAAEGVSADGRVIVGSAEDENGDERAFLIRR